MCVRERGVKEIERERNKSRTAAVERGEKIDLNGHSSPETG